MHPITHLLLGWGLANCVPGTSRRDRAIVAWVGVSPDLDGLGLFAEILTEGSAHPLRWWSEYHHVLGHNLPAAVVATGIAASLATSRLRTAGLACLSFHLHLFCDVVGSRGPDGHAWPIPYLHPFSPSVQWTWEGQWALNGWPNFLVTVVSLAAIFRFAHRHGRSPMELFTARMDGIFVEALRKRFPRSRGGA